MARSIPGVYGINIVVGQLADYILLSQLILLRSLLMDRNTERKRDVVRVVLSGLTKS